MTYPDPAFDYVASFVWNRSWDCDALHLGRPEVTAAPELEPDAARVVFYFTSSRDLPRAVLRISSAELGKSEMNGLKVSQVLDLMYERFGEAFVHGYADFRAACADRCQRHGPSLSSSVEATA